jgi:hypothetical protein
MTPLQKAAWNKAIRDSVDALLHKGGYNEELSAWHQLAMMNFDVESEQAQAVEPTCWHPTDAAITALKRFEETCADNEGYDVPKDTMRNLQAIGLIYRTHGRRYCITDFGNHILATSPAKAEKS